jgi:hypothetical protein
MNDSAAASPTFQFVTHWKTESAENRRTVLAFWEREGALANDVQASERLNEVVLHACHRDGDVAGVCTVVPMTLPRLGQPMYYYRCFIGRDWRKSRLVFSMLNRAFDVLEDSARSDAYPCIGVVLELENTRFGDTLRAPVWPSTGFVYIGKSGRGLELRVRYFRGARLKRSVT